MVQSKSKTIISWADEVEKEEEEEAARAQVCENQKPNPLGSARPREVVLHERGIDWRQLDEDFRAPFHFSIQTQKENPLKENITPSAAVAVDRKQVVMPQSRIRGPQQKLKNVKMDSYGSKLSQGPQNPTNHTYVVFVPPLKYPPRALLPNLFPPTHSPFYNPHLIHTGPKKIQNDIELEMEQFQTRNVSSHGRHIHGYNGDHKKHKIVQKNGTFENGRRNFEAFGNTRILRKSASSQMIGKKVLSDRDMYKEKSCFLRHRNNRMMTIPAVEKIQWEKMGGENERKSFPGKCVGSGRAEKRERRSSGTENSHYHQKRI
ncbi:hypothetical protein LOK49_LG15G00140 [Camellia lanceoleosa]|uniref:Uncharacterized protein n=1 Tax=Camellia lanceoleosa TaxID=1840588 RepID=A0ACC0F618_9ERIC|nr:hypothetical protein LOK49_LG15G00140 [Camellia lanceoleosa]